MLPKVMMICIDCPEEREKEKIREAGYGNLEVQSVCMETEGLKKVLQTILSTQCAYICFGEKDRVSDPVKIGRMVEYLERNREHDVAMCLNRYMDEEGEVAQHVQDGWMEYIVEDKLDDGFLLLNFALYSEVNILGNLENYMLRREAYLNKAFLLDGIRINKTEERMMLLLENIYGMKVGIVPEMLVSSREKGLDAVKLYEDYFWYQDLRGRIMKHIGRTDYLAGELPSVYKKMIEESFDRRTLVPELKKEITFFYTDLAEYNNLKPIGEEAVRRGYRAEFSEEIDKSVEIGVYCSHVNIIKNKGGGNQAKFSVILLHDMMQGETGWPNLWECEPWEGFDIGIVPGRDWAQRWKRCSGFRYVHPRLGVYELGYPKGDRIHKREFGQYIERFRGNMGLKYQYSVLYAPSWENDGKEDDFVKALQGLEVNLLVKPPICDERSADILENIQEMRKLHEGKYDNLYYIAPEEDIFTALGICDMVVSDESNVMAEALLFGKPSIAVTDWVIPREGLRYARVSVDYVYKCRKEQLGECVGEVLGRIKAGEITAWPDEVFSNVGRSASDIMDLLEYYMGRKEECGCLEKEVCPTHMLHGLWDA